MKAEDAIPILELFIEKTKKLENSNFVKRVIDKSRVGITLEVGKPIITERVGPNDENIDAFVLTFRFFIQDKDNISIRKLKKIFNSNLVTQSERNEYNKTRDQLNSYLDESSNININGDITNRNLMDTFIYGGLSHATEKNKQQYDAWMGRDDAVDFLHYKFCVVIFSFMCIIRTINSLCVSVLKQLKIS